MVVHRLLWHSSEARHLPGGSPRLMDGEPVLSVGEALRMAEIAPRTASFLVGGWLPRFELRTCAFAPTRDEDCRLRVLGEQPFAGTGRATFPVATVEFPLESATSGPAQTAVLRVHQRPGEPACGERPSPTCQRVLVVEDWIWDGPSD